MRHHGKGLIVISLLATFCAWPDVANAQTTKSQEPATAWQRYPTSLPSAFVDAAVMLFENGLEDPTGGEYRYITITVPSSLTNEQKQISTRGWVLTDKESGREYAVCWDGMRYEVDKVGSKAYISRDLVPPNQPEQPVMMPFMFAPSPYPAFSPHTRVGAALLYRLKDEYNARKILPKQFIDRGTYLWRETLGSYVTTRFHRGVAEFLKGDDERALAILDPLVALTEKIDAEYAGFPDHIKGEVNFNRSFPVNLRRLRDDIADRIENPRTVVRDLNEIESLPGFDRVLQCTINMRQISLEMYAQRAVPYPTDVTPDQIAEIRAELEAKISKLQTRYDSYYGLIESLGDETVPHLLDVAREDKYAARHVSSYFRMTWRQDPNARAIPFASDLAGSMAREIIDPLYAGDLAPDGTKYDQWEAYWNRYRHVPIPQRYFLILGENDRPVEAWVNAVSRLVQVIQPRLEPRRLKHSTFLTDEVVSEVFQILDRRLDNAIERSAIDFVLTARVAWVAYMLDPHRAKHFLAAPIANLTARLDARDGYVLHGGIQGTAQEITILRLQIGDDSAAEEYLHILERYLDGSTFDIGAKHLPLVLFPQIPEFEQYLTEMFEEYSKRSIERRLYMYGNPNKIAPFLAFETLRPRIAQLLEETVIIGRISVVESRAGTSPNQYGQYFVSVRRHIGSGNSGSSALVSEEELGYIGTEQDVRIKDLVANSLSLAKIGPPFEMFWELERRNAVIEDYGKLVLKSGFDVKNLPALSYSRWWMSDQPVFLRKRSVHSTLSPWPPKGM